MGPSQTDGLDALGRWLLSAYDWRHVGVLAIVVAILCGLIRKKRREDWGGPGPLLNAALGVFMISSGLTTAAVFLLTKPVAVEEITSETAAMAGIATLFSTVALGWRAVKEASGFGLGSFREQPHDEDAGAGQQERKSDVAPGELPGAGERRPRAD